MYFQPLPPPAQCYVAGAAPPAAGDATMTATGTAAVAALLMGGGGGGGGHHPHADGSNGGGWVQHQQYQQYQQYHPVVYTLQPAAAHQAATALALPTYAAAAAVHTPEPAARPASPLHLAAPPPQQQPSTSVSAFLTAPTLPPQQQQPHAQAHAQMMLPMVMSTPTAANNDNDQRRAAAAAAAAAGAADPALLGGSSGGGSGSGGGNTTNNNSNNTTSTKKTNRNNAARDEIEPPSRSPSPPPPPSALVAAANANALSDDGTPLEVAAAALALLRSDRDHGRDARCASMDRVDARLVELDRIADLEDVRAATLSLALARDKVQVAHARAAILAEAFWTARSTVCLPNSRSPKEAWEELMRLTRTPDQGRAATVAGEVIACSVALRCCEAERPTYLAEFAAGRFFLGDLGRAARGGIGVHLTVTKAHGGLTPLTGRIFVKEGFDFRRAVDVAIAAGADRRAAARLRAVQLRRVVKRAQQGDAAGVKELEYAMSRPYDDLVQALPEDNSAYPSPMPEEITAFLRPELREGAAWPRPRDDPLAAAAEAAAAALTTMSGGGGGGGGEATRAPAAAAPAAADAAAPATSRLPPCPARAEGEPPRRNGNNKKRVASAGRGEAVAAEEEEEDGGDNAAAALATTAAGEAAPRGRRRRVDAGPEASEEADDVGAGGGKHRRRRAGQRAVVAAAAAGGGGGVAATTTTTTAATTPPAAIVAAADGVRLVQTCESDDACLVVGPGGNDGDVLGSDDSLLLHVPAAASALAAPLLVCGAGDSSTQQPPLLRRVPFLGARVVGPTGRALVVRDGGSFKALANACLDAGQLLLLAPAGQAGRAAAAKNRAAFRRKPALLCLGLGDCATTVAVFEHHPSGDGGHEVTARSQRVAADVADGTLALSVFVDPKRCCCGGGGGGGGGVGGESEAPSASSSAAIDSAFVLVKADDSDGATKYELKHGTVLVSSKAWAVKGRPRLEQRPQAQANDDGDVDAVLVELRFYVSAKVAALCANEPRVFAQCVALELAERCASSSSSSSSSAAAAAAVAAAASEDPRQE